MKKFFGDFTDRESVLRQFDVKEEDFVNSEIIFAIYSCEGYEGSAFVLFKKDESLFEVNGGHCSCYGLEGQFEPEETTVEALRYRITYGTLGQDLSDGHDNYGSDLMQALNNLEITLNIGERKIKI